MKTCCGCKQSKGVEFFNHDSRSPDRLHPRCKLCVNAWTARWRKENSDRVKTYQQRYVEKNPEAVRASKQTYFDANKPKAMAAARKWQTKNPHKVNANTARRYASKTRSTPAWARPWVIQLFYLKARYLTETTGVAHHVDHIIPLRSKWVCGLHVEHNLQVLTGSENVAKNNKFVPGQDY